MADRLVVRVLGPVRLRDVQGCETALRGHAARLLATLALHAGQAWAADALAQRLWPDGPPATARTAVQGHVSRLRRLLGDRAAVRIETVAGGYVLHAAREAVDALRFADLCSRAGEERAAGRNRAAVTSLQDALDLWSGGTLAALGADHLPEAEAAALDDQRRTAEEHLADLLVEGGHLDEALRLLARLVTEEPLRERRWALLMVALTRAGRQTDALRAYRTAAATIADHTGLDPGPGLRRLETAILLQDPALDAARWQPAPGSAPAPLTGIVGRDTDRAAVVTRLSGARMVTLVGPGGVGKTTLGIDVAAALADVFSDGVIVVDLGDGGPDEVDAALAAAVGVATVAPDAPSGPGAAPGPDTADTPRTRAVTALGGREVLVVLDGCEHVRAQAASLATELLRAGPGLRVLATSQVPLGVVGEALVDLGPLPVPPEGAGAAEARRSPACELLARRLDEMGCPLDGDAGWEHAASIVRAVDGLPLAIEIAAAGAHTQPLAAVAGDLARDTGTLLTAEPPAGAGRRHLGATLDAAVERLDPEAAGLYAHLSVLPAGFGVEAAAAVAGTDPRTARAALGRLAAASLVVLDGDRARGRLLAPVRAHAATRLDPPAAAAARRRLTGWCIALAADLDERLRGPGQVEAVERFVAELPTFRAVLRRLIDSGEIADAATLFERLSRLWGDSPAQVEARVWGDELLLHADRLPPGPRARLETAIVHSQFAFELMAAKLDVAEGALRRAEQAGDAFSLAAAQVQVAVGLGWRNLDLDRAADLIDRSRAGMLALGEPYWAAVVLEIRGLLALRRLHVVQGIATLEEAAAEHRLHGGPADVAHALSYIGYARSAVGDWSGARRAFEEAARLLGSIRVGTWLRSTVGAAHAALGLGDVDAAVASFRAAHDRAVEVGDRRVESTALVGLAVAARRQGATDRCVALLASAAEAALAGGDPTDAATAAAILGEMLVAAGADEEAAVVLSATDQVPDQVRVRAEFGLALDPGPLRAAVSERLGPRRAGELATDGRVIGLGAAVRRAAEWLLASPPTPAALAAPLAR